MIIPGRIVMSSKSREINPPVPVSTQEGLSKRELFALHLLNGILAGIDHTQQLVDLPTCASTAVEAAEALVKALEAAE